MVKNSKKRTRNRAGAKQRSTFKPNVDPRPVGQPRSGRKKASKSKPNVTHVRAVCSITDPFCPASKNSKWPDGTAGNTMTEQLRGTYTITTTANGNSCVALASGATYGYLVPASSTATVVTLNTTYQPYRTFSLLSTAGDQYRIVSFGVIARCVASATTASGLITFGTSAEDPVNNSAVTLGTEQYDEVVTKAIQPGMELCWIAKPRGPTAREFRAQSTTSSVPSDWTNLTIEVTGCPATTAMVNIEWFLNIEFSVKTRSTLASLAPKNPPSVPLAVTATSHVHNTLSSFVEGGLASVEQAVAKHASDALNTILSDPLESIASLFSFM